MIFLIVIDVKSTPQQQIKVHLGKPTESSFLACDARKENCPPVDLGAKWPPKTQLGDWLNEELSSIS